MAMVVQTHLNFSFLEKCVCFVEEYVWAMRKRMQKSGHEYKLRKGVVHIMQHCQQSIPRSDLIWICSGSSSHDR